MVSPSIGTNLYAPNSSFSNSVSEILVKNPSANVYYTTLEKGTIPGVKSMANAGGAEHVYTWTVAYNIEGIRDWIFKQKK